jgi:addiction module RelE/StbE family toxin
MINIIIKKTVQKKLSKASLSLREQFKVRVRLFEKNTTDPILNNHALKGIYKGCRSINITGDYRLIFKEAEQDVVVLLDIDTHSGLYR